VLVIYDANVEHPIHSESLQLLHNVALHLGLTLIEKPVKSYEEAENKVSAHSKEGVNGIFIVCTNLFSRDYRTPAIAIKRKLPLHGCPTQVKKHGALVSYGPDFYYIGRRGA